MKICVKSSAKNKTNFCKGKILRRLEASLVWMFEGFTSGRKSLGIQIGTG